jgi:predicted ester cyclase
MSEASSIGRRFFEAQDRLRGGPDPELVTVDYTADLNGMHFDLAGHQEFAAGWYAGFPDTHHIIESVDIAPAAERVRFRLLGTHTGDFMGIPPTGKPVDVSADVIMTIEDGKVESVIGSFDQAGLMKQLGVE